MKNQKPESRRERYTSSASTDHRKRRRSWWPWVMTLGIILIGVGLAFAINHSSGMERASDGAPSSQSSNHTNQASDNHSSDADSERIDNFKNQLNDAANEDGNISKAAGESLQKSIKGESDQAVKAEEQKLLDRRQQEKGQPSSRFDTPHTFSSVQDAQSWARATKSEWLQAGFTNYTITSDGQGNYVLKFTR